MMNVQLVVTVIIVLLHVTDMRQVHHHHHHRQHRQKHIRKHHRRQEPAGADRVALEELRAHQNPWETTDGFEGDLDFPMRTAIRDKKYRWKNREVPYEVDDNFFDDEKQLIIRSLDAIGKLTCIKPRPRVPQDTESVLFVIERGKGCYSWIGSHHKLQQKIYLDRDIGCVQEATIKHEFLHTLGLFHQQSQTDRDNYIRINWENIKPGREDNFAIPAWATDHFGLEYDFDSIMQYSPYAFSKNGLPTIESKIPGKYIRKNYDLSQMDVIKINKMYNCA